jgi:hypothetical protein
MSRSRLAADNPPATLDASAPLRWQRHYMDASALVAWCPPYSVERWGKRFRLVHRPIGGERTVVGGHKTLSAAKAAAAAHRQQEQQQETTI